jgi:serine/threonine protein kinase
MIELRENTMLGNYKVGRLISDEASTEIYEGLNTLTGEKVVLKFPKFGCEQTNQEQAILPRLLHTHIIQLKDVIPTRNGACLVFPFAQGGDLYNVLTEGPLRETDARSIIFHVLSALSYLHRQNVWHRDIKPENILIMSNEFDPNSVVLSDFGYSDEFDRGWSHRCCGSPHYCAPEMYRREAYNEKADIWSLGITLFACLTGSFPYDSSNQAKMANEIAQGIPRLTELKLFQGIPILAQDLLVKMLEKDIDARISAQDALAHPWFDATSTICSNSPSASVCCGHEMIPQGEPCSRWCA